VNAGQCFQTLTRRAGAQGALALISAHPKDPGAKALFAWRRLHQLAYYSKAAENYEDFGPSSRGEGNDALGNGDVPLGSARATKRSRT